MTSYQRDNRAPLVLGPEIGGGGEGKIYQVQGESGLVAKMYTDPTQRQSDKLAAMLANPPFAPGWHQQKHIPLAWPLQRVYNWQGQCVGFLMPYIDVRSHVPLLKLYNPRTRLKTLSLFSWRYLLQAATNLTSIMCLMHQNGYMIGDVNESNILVSTSALVTLVDCDSCQVPGKNGQVFRCAVGKPEYTPPELQGRDFHSLNREFYHDTFGLAVLIFQMLMEGVHPFTGVWQGAGNPPSLEQNIQAGNSPYLPKSILRRQPKALPLETLPPELQELTIRCFGEGHRMPTRRPRAEEWFEALQQAEKQIVSCRFNKQHWYSQHLSVCPWCERMKLGLPDPFPAQAPPPPLPRITIQLPAHPTAQPAPPAIPAQVYMAQTYPSQSRTASAPPLPTSAYPVYPTRATGQMQTQMQTQMFAPQQMVATPKVGQRPRKGVLLIEFFLSIFGIFGIGWCLAGRGGKGLLMLIASFCLYLPIVTSQLQDGNTGCVLLFAIGAILINLIQLNSELEKRARKRYP